MKSIKHDNYSVARKFGTAFKFADDIIAVNDGNELGNQYNVIYWPDVISARELVSSTDTTFLNLHLFIKDPCMMKRVLTISVLWICI